MSNEHKLDIVGGLGSEGVQKGRNMQDLVFLKPDLTASRADDMKGTKP